MPLPGSKLGVSSSRILSRHGGDTSWQQGVGGAPEGQVTGGAARGTGAGWAGPAKQRTGVGIGQDRGQVAEGT